MLLHLLFFLVHRNRARRGQKRKREVQKIVLDCPLCKNLGLAVHVIEEEATGSTFGPTWQTIREVYQCSKCNHTMNAEAFTNDGTGVLKARTWQCSHCKVENTNLALRCRFCGNAG